MRYLARHSSRSALLRLHTDSPSTPLYLQKFFSGTVLNYLGTFNHSSKRSISPTDHLNRSLRYWQTTKMAHTPAKCSFVKIANITCGSSRAKDNFFLLNECDVQVKNHLRSCNLSRTKVTEYDLIWQGRESLILLMNK